MRRHRPGRVGASLGGEPVLGPQDLEGDGSRDELHVRGGDHARLRRRRRTPACRRAPRRGSSRGRPARPTGAREATSASVASVSGHGRRDSAQRGQRRHHPPAGGAGRRERAGPARPGSPRRGGPGTGRPRARRRARGGRSAARDGAPDVPAGRRRRAATAPAATVGSLMVDRAAEAATLPPPGVAVEVARARRRLGRPDG